MTDQEKIRLGFDRLDTLEPSERGSMWRELAAVIARHGWEPQPKVIMHVAGNVSEVEWQAAVSRMRASQASH